MDQTSFLFSAEPSGTDGSTTLYDGSDYSRAYTLQDALPQATGDSGTDALVWFSVPRWNYEIPNDGNTVYYMFMTEPLLSSHYGDAVVNFSEFTDAQKSAVRSIFDEAEALTGLDFVETTDRTTADIFFGNSDIVADYTVGMTYSYVDYATDASGELTYLERFDFVYMDNAEFASTTLSPEAGNYGYEYLMHEIGHTLGLDDTAVTGILAAQYDTTDYTVMSYNEGTEGPQSSYQELDVSALNYIYGTSSRSLTVDSSALYASAGSSALTAFAQA